MNAGNDSLAAAFDLDDIWSLGNGSDEVEGLTLHEVGDSDWFKFTYDPAYRLDIGIAFDGDFDRCFFFDEKGNFVPGEYIVGFLASVFLDKEPYAQIVHDPRVIWNIQDLSLIHI